MASKATPRRAPARTVKAREDQLISLSVDLVEKRLREGTATSAEILHYLRLGSTKNELEKEKLRRENQLLEAKAESIKSMKRSEELVGEAIKAFRAYSGKMDDEDDYDAWD